MISNRQYGPTLELSNEIDEMKYRQTGEDFGAKCYYLAFLPGKAEVIHGAAAQSAVFTGTPNGAASTPQIILSQTPTGGTPMGPTGQQTQMINTLTGG